MLFVKYFLLSEQFFIVAIISNNADVRMCQTIYKCYDSFMDILDIDLLCNFDSTIVIQKPGSLINKCGTATSENSSGVTNITLYL